MNPAALDPVIHPPARLQIAALLAAVTDAEFATLQALASITERMAAD